MTARQFTQNCQQVLCNGAHFADARDAAAAEQIVAAFNDRASIAAMVEREGNRRQLRSVRRLARIVADAIRARMDVVDEEVVG